MIRQCRRSRSRGSREIWQLVRVFSLFVLWAIRGSWEEQSGDIVDPRGPKTPKTAGGTADAAIAVYSCPNEALAKPIFGAGTRLPFLADMKRALACEAWREIGGSQEQMTSDWRATAETVAILLVRPRSNTVRVKEEEL